MAENSNSTTVFSPPAVVGTGLPNANAVVGETGGVASASSSTSPSVNSVGATNTYTVVVQVPVPFAALNLNLSLLGDFILPALSALGVPPSVTWYLENYPIVFQGINDDIQTLLKAVPEATARVLVKVGPAVVLNLEFVAEKVLVNVPLPSFALGLPNLAVDPNFVLSIPFPAADPQVIRVPIPVPQLPTPAIAGGISATATAAVEPAPFPITNPIHLPQT